MRVTVVLPRRNTSPVANVNSKTPPLRSLKVAWPISTKRMTLHITSALAAALWRDEDTGRDFASVPHVDRRVLAPAPVMDKHRCSVGDRKSRKRSPRLLLANRTGLAFLVGEQFLGALFFTPGFLFRLGSLPGRILLPGVLVRCAP